MTQLEGLQPCVILSTAVSYRLHPEHDIQLNFPMTLVPMPLPYECPSMTV